MAIDNDKLMEFLGSFVGDLGATVAAGNVVRRAPARPLRGAGRRTARDARRAGRAHRHRRAAVRHASG